MGGQERPVLGVDDFKRAIAELEKNRVNFSKIFSTMFLPFRTKGYPDGKPFIHKFSWTNDK